MVVAAPVQFELGTSREGQAHWAFCALQQLQIPTRQERIVTLAQLAANI